MAPQEKFLSKDNVDVKSFGKITELATQVINGITASTRLVTALDLSKKILKDMCLEIFQKDVKDGVVYGNHIIVTSVGNLMINFKMSPESDISEHEKTLRAEFKDDYAGLFRELPKIDVTTAYPNQKLQFQEHPELFTLTLRKNITMGDMAKLFKKTPDMFELQIRDKERYAEVYPLSVKTEKKVYPSHGFLEKLGNISDTLRKRCINILAKYFDKNLECAVKPLQNPTGG